MADGRKNNGGHKNAGRKPKVDEIAKIEMMDSVSVPLNAWNELWKKCKDGDTNAIKFWIEHRFGKAKETIELNNNKPSFNLNSLTDAEIEVLSKMYARNEPDTDTE